MLARKDQFVKQQLRFSKTAIASVALPKDGKRATIYDLEIPKLAVRVTTSGSKTFYVVKRAAGSLAWIKLGAFPDMTVEQARGEATKVLAEFTHGINPAAVRRAYKQKPTLAEFFIEFGDKHGSKKISWKDDQQRFTTYIEPKLGKKKLVDIDRQSIREVIEGAAKAGKATGTQRQIRALISTILGKAVEWEKIPFNPVSGVKIAGGVTKRDRFLTAKELPLFLAALKAEANVVMRDFILIALLTGARRSNLLDMHWDDIDLKHATWRINRTKNGTPQVVVLSSQAIQILKSTKSKNTGGYVFPAESDSGHIEDPKKALIRILQAAKIPYGRKVKNGVTFHDLRRTLGSWQAMTGASLPIIGKSLNHQSLAATEIYARLEVAPVRAAVKKATDAMFAQRSEKK